MSEPTLQDCINYMRSQIRQMEKHPRNYEFNLPYYRKTVELLEKDRPHVEWIETYYSIDGVGASRFKCSKCENEISTYGKPYNFCPNCGADMRVKDELNRVRKELNSEIEKSKSEIVPDYRDGWRLREGEAE